MVFDLPLPIPRALPTIKLLAIEAPLPVDLLVDAASGGGTGSCELLFADDVRIVHLVVVQSRITSLNITALDIMVAQTIVRNVILVILRR